MNIRYQLEDLRLICDLVKRREKSKQKLQICERDSFGKKIELIDPEYTINQRKPASPQYISQELKKQERTLPAPTQLS